MKEKEGWNPYVTGALTGIVAVLSVLIAGKFFGASTSYVRSAGLIEKFFAPQRIAPMDYFIKYIPEIDWQFMFVIGVLLGSFIAAITSGNFRLQAVPDMWKARFGSSIARRAITAFVGGVIAIFGARLAGGCPSGHGLSGVMQLSVSGFIALISFFIAGAIVARSLYRGGDKK